MEAHDLKEWQKKMESKKKIATDLLLKKHNRALTILRSKNEDFLQKKQTEKD